jgi:hypothetical protein
MSTKWALLKAIQREPDNALHCFVMADLLEEQGWPDLSFCYRWMGWYGRQPGFREGKYLRKRFVWDREEAFEAWPSDETHRYHALPRARLDPLIFQTMETPNHPFQLYTTWEQAVQDLAKGLAKMRSLELRLLRAVHRVRADRRAGEPGRRGQEDRLGRQQAGLRQRRDQPLGQAQLPQGLGGLTHSAPASEANNGPRLRS